MKRIKVEVSKITDEQWTAILAEGFKAVLEKEKAKLKKAKRRHK